MKKPSIITHHELVMEIVPTARKNPVPPLTNISILDIFEHLKQWGYEDKQRLFNHNYCGLLPIININETKDRIDVLLCLSDKDSDDPEALDFETKTLRHFDKSDSEGYNERSHIVIHIQADPRVAKFVIEYKQGISPRVLTETLNYFIKDATKNHPDIFQGNHPTDRDAQGNAKKVNFRVKFTAQAVLSDEIIQAFENGRVTDVIYHQPIIHATDHDGIGYTPKRQDVYMDVKANIIKPKSKNMVQKARDIKHSFEQFIGKKPELKGFTFTIRFKNKEGKIQTAYYHSDTQEFSLAKKSYVRKENKNPKELTLNQKFCDRMYAHLLS